ncbi:hypothetical protein HDU98_012259 [Podochytrium sp. JEL0797]|nr:hypothetical protein HDU98_012259 [Podochytrium sp. JEL0797]
MTHSFDPPLRMQSFISTTSSSASSFSSNETTITLLPDLHDNFSYPSPNGSISPATSPRRFTFTPSSTFKSRSTIDTVDSDSVMHRKTLVCRVVACGLGAVVCLLTVLAVIIVLAFYFSGKAPQGQVQGDGGGGAAAAAAAVQTIAAMPSVAVSTNHAGQFRR